MLVSIALLAGSLWEGLYSIGHWAGLAHSKLWQWYQIWLEIKYILMVGYMSINCQLLQILLQTTETHREVLGSSLRLHSSTVVKSPPVTPSCQDQRGHCEPVQGEHDGHQSGLEDVEDTRYLSLHARAWPGIPWLSCCQCWSVNWWCGLRKALHSIAI